MFYLCLVRRVILFMPCCRTALRVFLPDIQGRLIDNDEIIEPVFFLPRTRVGLQILVVSRCDGVTLKRRELWRNWRLVWCLICISVAWSVFLAVF